MTDTKRVDELEVEDVVIFAGSKGSSTISSIETKVDEVDSRNLLFVIYTEETEKPLTYLGEAQVTYLCNNKKEKETMKNQKVDCSALYPYFDSLANEELTFKDNNVPVYVYLKHQLKYIHELFEGVLDLTLEEVKALYFERKMSKQESKIKDNSKTKRVSELKEGDVFQYGKSTSTVSRVENEPAFDSVRLYFYQMGNPTTLPKDLEVVVLN